MNNEFKNISEAYVCEHFDKVYNKLAPEGDLHRIKSLFENEAGFLLLDVCDLIPHAPHIRSIAPIDAVMTSMADDIPILIYTFHYTPRSIGENVMIIIAKTKDSKIRMLALETHRERYYLCEYIGHSHMNYGEVAPEKLGTEIVKMLHKNPLAHTKEEVNEQNISYSHAPGGYVSHRGDWGDKIIITLHSDGKRRHKKWCEHYSDDNHCAALCRKCIGSSHCEYYNNENESSSDIFHHKNDIIEQDNQKKHQSDFVWCELYRAASYGDKLLNQTVLVKRSPFTFRICEVTEEDFHFFSVEYDGKKHKFDKKVAYRNRSVYIFKGVEKTKATEDI